MKNTVLTLIKIVACFALAFAVTARVQAQTNAGAQVLKAGLRQANSVIPGTWQWTVPSRNGGPDRTNILVLKIEAGKVKGTLTDPGVGDTKVETPIDEVKLTGGEISFSVTREFNGNKRTRHYSGQLSPDTIKGQIKFETQNGEQQRDWEAKRVEEKK